MSFTEGVDKRVLPNGLRVLVKEQRTAPVTAVVAHVRVGYFNEPDRWNGISHVIEHMLFKGTRSRPHKEQIASDVRSIGGSINAGTYYEDTSYYITVPSRHTETAVEILADMLQRALIDPDELAKELNVIIQESKQKRDNPRAMLFETMYAKAFDLHRIRRWRIGEDETLRNLRHEDLAEFVSKTYVPENIVLTIVGDIEVEEAHSMAHRHWGVMERTSLQREVSPAETSPPSFRYHRITGDIQQRLVSFGFHAPPALHPSTPALMVLDAVLSDGRSSRFHRSLKEEQRLVTSASASYEGFQDIGIFTLSAELPQDDPLPAEKGLLSEIYRLVSEGVHEDELVRVKTRLNSRWVFAQEEVMGLARTLSSYEALGGFKIADDLRSRIESAGPADVTNAAAQFLKPAHSTLVEYLPSSACSHQRSTEDVWSGLAPREPMAASPVAAPPSSRPAMHKPAATMNASDSEVTLRELSSGTTLIHRVRRDLPIVAVHVVFPGGRIGESERNAGITNLLLKSSRKGTESYNAAELAERVEDLGTSIGLTLAADYLGYSMKLLSPVALKGIGLLKEILTSPTFPVDEIQKEKESIYAEIRRQRDSMFSRALELFNAARFGDHPYGLPASGLESALAEMDQATVRSWHSRWIRSQRAIISVVGDISLNSAIDVFSDLIPHGSSSPFDAGYITPEGRAECIEEVDRHQTASVMGFDGAAVTSNDRHALDLIAEITSGLAGRFFQAVRGESALAYAVTSFHRTRARLGTFGTYTATSPDKERIARDIILMECARMAKEPVSEQELRDAKAAIRGEQTINNQTFGAQAGEAAVNRLYGLPMDEADRYLARIDEVTQDEIMATAAAYLRPDRYWLGVVRGSGGG